jgi:hypothetical protein
MTKDDEIAQLRTSLAYAQLEKTLRDEFAMAALTGYTSNLDEFYVHEVVKSCYIVADAMMKERHK